MPYFVRAEVWGGLRANWPMTRPYRAAQRVDVLGETMPDGVQRRLCFAQWDAEAVPAGQIENSQIDVLLAYGSPSGHAFLDRVLQLSKAWLEDAARQKSRRGWASPRTGNWRRWCARIETDFQQTRAIGLDEYEVRR